MSFEDKETEFSDGLNLGYKKEELRMTTWFLSWKERRTAGEDGRRSRSERGGSVVRSETIKWGGKVANWIYNLSSRKLFGLQIQFMHHQCIKCIKL